ncbi:hypothetical protein [Mucilaginibacter sp.]|uniref:hypothetical protein n=1 Tax=Mucilaginibacter sp. TaxID=1882438 RepID=UPI0025DE8FE5|nr:hypothetical protein [Mucilaginibacter sp.]
MQKNVAVHSETQGTGWNGKIQYILEKSAFLAQDGSFLTKSATKNDESADKTVSALSSF